MERIGISKIILKWNLVYCKLVFIDYNLEWKSFLPLMLQRFKFLTLYRYLLASHSVLDIVPSAKDPAVNQTGKDLAVHRCVFWLQLQWRWRQQTNNRIYSLWRCYLISWFLFCLPLLQGHIYNLVTYSVELNLVSWCYYPHLVRGV